MRKCPRRFVRVSAILLTAVLIILSFSGLAARAQTNLPCATNPTFYQGQLFSPQYWAPGQSNLNVTLVDPAAPFTGGHSASQVGYYVMTQASYNNGNFTTEDPNVTVSNLQYVNPTTIAFTVSVLAGAPIEQDGFALWCPFAKYNVSPGIFITPCATPVTPTITSILPAT